MQRAKLKYTEHGRHGTTVFELHLVDSETGVQLTDERVYEGFAHFDLLGYNVKYRVDSDAPDKFRVMGTVDEITDTHVVIAPTYSAPVSVPIGKFHEWFQVD